MKEYEKKPDQVNQEKIRWDNMIEKVMSIKNNSKSEIYFKGILSPLPLTTIFSLSGFQNSFNKPEWSPSKESKKNLQDLCVINTHVKWMLGAEACSTTPPFRFFCFARHVEEEIAFLVNSFLFKLWLKHLCEKRPRGGGEKTEEPYHRDHLGGGGWSVRDVFWLDSEDFLSSRSPGGEMTEIFARMNE